MPATSTAAPRNVLITGASTGIGAACARMLAGRGWRVFAGVRKMQDGEALVAGAEGQIIPVILDVTNREQIKTVVQEIGLQCGEAGLQGVVNNAGIALAGPLEFMPMEAFERQFEINVLGLIAVTQAVMPLIRAGHGRVVLMGSNSGFMCEPFLAGYGATKHAVEAIADSLRIELRPWGIDVALIEPGAIKTPIWERAAKRADDVDSSLSQAHRELYGEMMTIVREGAMRIGETAPDVSLAANAVVRAIEARRAPIRVLVGGDAKSGAFFRWLLPARVFDHLIARKFGLR